MGNQSLLRFLAHARFVQLRLHGGGVFTKCQGFRLGLSTKRKSQLVIDSFQMRLPYSQSACTYKIVTQENGMVVNRTVEVSRDVVLSLARSQEIAGNDFGSLVDQLIKCVLPVGSWFTPVICHENNGLMRDTVRRSDPFQPRRMNFATYQIMGPVWKSTLRLSLSTYFPFDSMSPCWK